jgi:hypothetical protein
MCEMGIIRSPTSFFKLKRKLCERRSLIISKIEKKMCERNKYNKINAHKSRTSKSP